MQTRIEMVDPLLAFDSAGEVLRAAWKPPSLHYSAEYLKWQFTFPGEVPAKIAMAFDGNGAIGCIAVTPRRFLLAGASITAYVMSFLAVDPVARGRGVAARLYAAIVETIPHNTPVIAFALPDGLGERTLLRSLTLASFHHKQLRPCRAAAYVAKSIPGPSLTSTSESIDFVEYSSMYLDGTDSSTLVHAPSEEQWQHYLADPRGRSSIGMRDSSGKLIGTAMTVGAEIVSAGGTQRVPMLESVYLGSSSADALRAAFAEAQKKVSNAVVIASNLSHLDENLPRSAGARAIPSIFNAYLFTRGQDVVGASSVNIEVI